MKSKNQGKQKTGPFSPLFSLLALVLCLLANLIITSGCTLCLAPTHEDHRFTARDEETVPPPDGCVGEYYSYDLHSCINLSGITSSITFVINDGEVLPVGLILDPDTGILSGEPEVAGDYDFTVTARNSSGIEPPADLIIRINEFCVTSEYLPPACSGEEYSAVINVCGGVPDFTYSVGGDAASFLDFSETGAIPSRQNTLVGTPPGAGNYNFTVSVQDSTGTLPVNKDFTLVVVDELKINSPQNLLPGIEDVEYGGETLQACGGTPPYTWSVLTSAAEPERRLPDGLDLDRETGDISGTPAAGTAGSWRFLAEAADSTTPRSNRKTKYFNITIAGSRLTVTPVALPTIPECGEVTAAAIARASGGIGEKHWQVSDVPVELENLEFSPSSGGEFLNVSGILNNAGGHTFRVSVSDAGPHSPEIFITITVAGLADRGIEITSIWQDSAVDPGNEIYLDEDRDGDIDGDDRNIRIVFRVTDCDCISDGYSFDAGDIFLMITGYCNEHIPATRLVDRGGGEYRAIFEPVALRDAIARTGDMTGDFRILNLRLIVPCSEETNPTTLEPYDDSIGNARDITVYRIRPPEKP